MEMHADAQVRPAAVAGKFYPSDPVILRSTIEQLFKLTIAPADEPRPKALIVPHAGYIYSGITAAHAYHTLTSHGSAITRVLLLGTMHRCAIPKIVLSPSRYFATPLGRILQDVATIATLASRFPVVVVREDAHVQEHSLEVQLPFLQEQLPSFQLIAMAVGAVDSHRIADLLSDVVRPDDLIVVSTDLSHYLSRCEASYLDERTADAIVALDTDRLAPSHACGYYALCGLMAFAKERQMTIKRLDVRNSADTGGPPARVVGYGAFRVD